MDEEIKKILQDAFKGNSAEDLKRKRAFDEAMSSAKENNKVAKKRIDFEIKALNLAQDQFDVDTKEYKLLKKGIKDKERELELNEKLNDITQKVGQSFMGLGKAAFEGQGSISAFTDNVKGLGLIGQRLDVNIETFRQLSQSGANFGQSIVELRTAAAEAALPLDDFASLVANNSSNLAALFGSTTQGAKSIAALGAAVREEGIATLAPLGFTVDEINETLLLNLESQRRTGVFDRLTGDQQRKSAIAFASELDRLAKLTGQQRDQLRSQIESAMSNERFAVALQGQTEETRQRLQAFAGTVGGISPQLAEGFQDLIANGGVAVTDAARDIVQNVPQAGALMNQLIAGTLSSEEALVQLRNISASSVDRFSKATVTGQVEFLRLQGGFIELGRRVTDTGAVLDEQNAKVGSLTQNLTTFEQASKVLASQFQSIETGLLQAFGPTLGGLVEGVQGAFGQGGKVATMLAKSPGVTAGILLAGLGGKYLLDFGQQVAAITAGTFAGFKMAGGGGAGSIFSKGGAGRKGLGMAGKGVGILGGVGLAAGGAAQAGTAETAGGKAMGVLSSAAGGALTGFSVAGAAGIIPGLIAGGLIGGAGALFGGGKQFGGGMDAGKTYLTGEAGPEMVTAGTASTVTSNNDLKKIFNTEALESKMNTMVNALNSTNTNLTNMANGVNTLIAVESRALKAVEKTARTDRNQVGIV
ncbi:MAG: hypothetical protein CBC01_08180 [Betaproteobacteria bacterium TMED41]|nr:MAG: hypothetical protein CBC01_08180 [Betaproteobacteria bacterium TMED41]